MDPTQYPHPDALSSSPVRSPTTSYLARPLGSWVSLSLLPLCLLMAGPWVQGSFPTILLSQSCLLSSEQFLIVSPELWGLPGLGEGWWPGACWFCVQEGLATLLHPSQAAGRAHRAWLVGGPETGSRGPCPLPHTCWPVCGVSLHHLALVWWLLSNSPLFIFLCWC